MRLAVLDVGSNTIHLVVVDGQPDGTFVPVARERETLRLQVVEAAAVVDRGDPIRLELRARDVPDLAMWAAERNGDLFELEFGRYIQPVAVDVT